MSARQLRLFAPAQPLLERLGPDFFRSIPRCPGVYTMRNEAGRILYIGQSKNLRTRLAYYKNARPEVVPGKLIRLIHQVATITWEECADAAAAAALEVRLLQRHRPRFNVAHTWPATWWYWGLRQAGEKLELRLISSACPASGERVYGAYKGQMLGRICFRALIRLLWACQERPDNPYAFPLAFSFRLYEWELHLTPFGKHPVMRSFPDGIHSLLEGQVEELLDPMKSVLAESDPDPWLSELYEHDLELLEDYFGRGPGDPEPSEGPDGGVNLREDPRSDLPQFELSLGKA